MGVAPTPAEIFQRAAEEGQRRLDQSWLELLATGFIAGFTIIFGIVTLGITHALVEPQFGAVAQLAGALVFGMSVVFLIVGRAELFSENFFHPIATAFERDERHVLRRILRLWMATFVLNLVGGALFALVFAYPGVLPSGASSFLGTFAADLVERDPWAGFMAGIAGGSLVALLSFLLEGSNSVASRILMAYGTGFLLALGPFDHVIVSGLHGIFGILTGAPVGVEDLLVLAAVVTAGNLVGGVGLVTLSHVAQAKGAEES